MKTLARTLLSSALLVALGSVAAQSPATAPAPVAPPAGNVGSATAPSDPLAHEPSQTGTAPLDRNAAPVPTQQAPAADPEAEFVRLDADGNGVLSRTEIAADGALALKLDALDADRNQEISRSEFARVRAGAAASTETSTEVASANRAPATGESGSPSATRADLATAAEGGTAAAGAPSAASVPTAPVASGTSAIGATSSAQTGAGFEDDAATSVTSGETAPLAHGGAVGAAGTTTTDTASTPGTLAGTAPAAPATDPAATAGFGSAPATAEAGDDFARHDRDGNGLITRAEWDQARGAAAANDDDSAVAEDASERD